MPAGPKQASATARPEVSAFDSSPNSDDNESNKSVGCEDEDSEDNQSQDETRDGNVIGEQEPLSSHIDSECIEGVINNNVLVMGMLCACGTTEKPEKGQEIELTF